MKTILFVIIHWKRSDTTIAAYDSTASSLRARGDHWRRVAMRGGRTAQLTWTVRYRRSQGRF
jgi:hypothetical protein